MYAVSTELLCPSLLKSTSIRQATLGILGAIALLVHSGESLAAQRLVAAKSDSNSGAEIPSASQPAYPEALPASNLGLRRVVLFTSGVGFFERRGEVEGQETVVLQFRREQINDVLKSIVVQDVDGGRVSSITYDAQEPIERTLQSLKIDLTNDPALIDLLHQLKGREIEITQEQTIRGTVVGVETRVRPVGELSVPIDVVNLLVDSRFQSVPIDEIQSFRIVDEQLNDDLNRGLQLLTRTRDQEEKEVSIDFRGDGERRVRVGYILEAPVWKTSYRLVLNDEGEPYLQGWAIVENTGEEDWDSVELTLVSGHPISFLMDLYQPLYAPRPTVVPDLFRSLVARVHRGDFGNQLPQVTSVVPHVQGWGGGFGGGGGAMGGMGGGGFGGGGGGFGGGGGGLFGGGEPAAPFDPSESVSSVATGSDVGELFQYAIDEPVTLFRQKSAMLPIVNSNVDGRKISAFHTTHDDEHPRNGFELDNVTDLHLMQGPITVFDGGNYAGDAQIPEVAPGAKRLLTYAIDQMIEVAAIGRVVPDRQIEARLEKGFLITTNRSTRETSYAIKNEATDEKVLLFETPRTNSWNLVEPTEGVVLTADEYRFELNLEAGSTQNLVVREETDAVGRTSLVQLSEGVAEALLDATHVSEDVKEALREIRSRREDINRMGSESSRLGQQLISIQTDQTRIRENLRALDRTSELYKTYIAKLTEQEPIIERLQTDKQRLSVEKVEAEQKLQDYVLQLDIR